MCSSVSCSTTTAVWIRSRSLRMRASSRPCSFFAAWYSKFSERSPNERAVAVASTAAARRGPSSSAGSASRRRAARTSGSRGTCSSRESYPARAYETADQPSCSSRVTSRQVAQSTAGTTRRLRARRRPVSSKRSANGKASSYTRVPPTTKTSSSTVAAARASGRSRATGTPSSPAPQPADRVTTTVVRPEADGRSTRR